MANFQLSGLAAAQFERYFSQSDGELELLAAKRVIATSNSGFPCRVSLRDAAAGERLLLFPYWHHPVDSPYRSLGPIFVREGAVQAVLSPGTVPDYVTRRLISIRAYDADAMMIAAEVREGIEVGSALQTIFDDGSVAYVHLHNAKPGCYSCLATRVP